MSECHSTICILGSSLFCKIQTSSKFTFLNSRDYAVRPFTEHSSHICLRAMGHEQMLTCLAISERKIANLISPLFQREETMFSSW